MRLVCSLQLERAQTFTSLSHPAETITGADGEGENRTHDTHSVWPYRPVQRELNIVAKEARVRGDGLESEKRQDRLTLHSST